VLLLNSVSIPEICLLSETIKWPTATQSLLPACTVPVLLCRASAEGNINYQGHLHKSTSPLQKRDRRSERQSCYNILCDSLLPVKRNNCVMDSRSNKSSSFWIRKAKCWDFVFFRTKLQVGWEVSVMLNWFNITFQLSMWAQYFFYKMVVVDSCRSKTVLFQL